MGNNASRRKELLDPEPLSWQAYVDSEWRSEKARDLDRFGGLGRSAVSKGNSTTAKLGYLERGLRKEQRRIKHVLNVEDETKAAAKKEAAANQRDVLAPPPDIVLNTDVRAWERAQQERLADPTSGSGAADPSGKDFSLLMKDDPEGRKQMALQRRKMLEYAKSVNVVKTPGVKLKQLDVPKVQSKVAQSWKNGAPVADGGSSSSSRRGSGDGVPSDFEDSGDGITAVLVPAAEWRQRVHAARRRAILTVWVFVRWQMALTRRPGPRRLPRVESFSYYIPQVLGEDHPRFVEEALAAARVRAQLLKAEEPAAEEEQPEPLSLPSPLRVLLEPEQQTPTPLAKAMQGQQQQQQPLASPGGLRPLRGTPLRRGISDSGVVPQAAVRAAAVAANSRAALVVRRGIGNRSRKSMSGANAAQSAQSMFGADASGASDSEPTVQRSSQSGPAMLPAIRRSSVQPDGEPGLPIKGPLTRLTTSRERRSSDSALAHASPQPPPNPPPGRGSNGGGGGAAFGRGLGPVARVRAAAPAARTSDNGASRLRSQGYGDGGSGSGATTPTASQAASVASAVSNQLGALHAAYLSTLQQSQLAGSPVAGSPTHSNGGGIWPSAGGVGLRRSENGLAPSNSSPAPERSGPSLFPSICGAKAGGSPLASSPSTSNRPSLTIIADNNGCDDRPGCQSPSSRFGKASLSPRVSVVAITGGCGGGGASALLNSPLRGSMDQLSILDQLSAKASPPLAPLASPSAPPGGKAEAGSFSPVESPAQAAVNRIRRSSYESTGSNGAIEASAGSITNAPSPGPSLRPRPPPTEPAAKPPPRLRPSASQLPSLPSGSLSPLPSGILKSPLERSYSDKQRSSSTAMGQHGAGGGGSSIPEEVLAAANQRLSKAQQMMSMYANRCNAQWAESQFWTTPQVLPLTEQEMFYGSDAWLPYKLNVLKMLKKGSFAVHIDACQDAVAMADGTSMDLWTSDPWAAVQGLRPGSLPMSERIEGVQLGARAMMALVLALQALAGKDALSQLVVVLAINEDQRNAVVNDIIRRRAYGLKAENIIITAQRKRCGYRYDKTEQLFLEDPSTPAAVLGGGYALCQLAWLGDAFSVKPDSGECVMLMKKTPLERFAERGIEWMVCRRARDLALLDEHGVLDLRQLAYGLYAADRHDANMVLQAAPQSSLTIFRAYDSTLLAHKRAPPSPSAATAGTSSRNLLRNASIAGQAAGIQGGGGAATIADLRAAELGSPVMVEALAAVKKASGDGWIGLQRYMLHVPTLHGMMHTMGLFRPKLTMSGDVARLALDTGDLTAAEPAHCVAVQAAKDSAAILTGPNEVDDLIPMLLSQDRSPGFRGSLCAANGTGAGDEGEARIVQAPALLAAAKPGQRLLVFVAANEVTQLAVNLVLMMARPGRDVVHLVTVVHNSLQQPTGHHLIMKYYKQLSAGMIEVHAEVMVKGVNGLLEVMDSAIFKLTPNMVVMGSAALTMSNLNTASVMGSVTLSMLKRCSLPTIVVTGNSKNLVSSGRRSAMRVLALVETSSRPMLHHMLDACIEPMRGDRVLLAAHHPTRQMTTNQTSTQQRLLNNFYDISCSYRMHSAEKLQLDGQVDKAVAAVVEESYVHLVGVQVPVGTKSAPGHVLGLIRSCKSGVLIFRDTM